MEISLNKAVELLDNVLFEVVNNDLYLNPVVLEEINTFIDKYYAERTMPVELEHDEKTEVVDE